jgi:dihydroflavonol-4-reductase
MAVDTPLALITGGTGFVGSHIARQWVGRGQRVRVLHRASSRLDALAGLNYESALGDILDADSLRRACEGCRWVFHVAAVADYWRADLNRMREANVEGTRRVLAAARETGVERVIFTSSAAALGLREDDTLANEFDDFNLSPSQFPYGHTKHLAEGVIAEAVRAGQDVVTLNPVVIMGPGDLNMISGSFVAQIKRYQWLTPIPSGGVAVTDVRDVARWHVEAAQCGRRGERYILGTANYAYREWFAMIADALKVARPAIRLPDAIVPAAASMITLLRRIGIRTPVDAAQTRLGTKRVYFEFAKAWEEFGAPEYSMDRSLADTVAWYIENGYLKKNALEPVITGLGRLLGRKPAR